MSSAAPKHGDLFPDSLGLAGCDLFARPFADSARIKGVSAGRTFPEKDQSVLSGDFIKTPHTDKPAFIAAVQLLPQIVRGGPDRLIFLFTDAAGFHSISYL